EQTGHDSGAGAPFSWGSGTSIGKIIAKFVTGSFRNDAVSQILVRTSLRSPYERPRVSPADTRSPAWMKNLLGRRPDSATRNSGSNLSAAIPRLIWNLAGARSGPRPVSWL